ncbi:hypothetical protein D3C84_258750 [compost metagenome]
MLGNHRVGRQIARGFQGRNQEDHRHRNERHPVKVEPVLEGHRHAHQRNVSHGGEIDIAHQPGEQVAQGQPDHNGPQPQEGHIDPVEHHDHPQHQRRQGQVVGTAQVRRAEAASDVGHGHLDQRQPHQGDDGAGHHRGNQHPQLADELAEHHFYEGGEEAHAENRRENLIGAATPGLDHEAGTEDHADERKTGALQAQQTGAHRAKASRLDEGAQAGNEQRHADQVRNFAVQAQGAAHDQGGGDDPDEARQHMLQGGKDRCGEVRAIVETVNQVGTRGSFRVVR